MNKMIIELFNFMGDGQGQLIKEFLINNNLKFHEIITDDINLLSSVANCKLLKPLTLIRVKYNHSIQVADGYNEHFLNQLLKHINKYKPKIE